MVGKKKICIVGGGVKGISVLHECQRQEKYDVHLFDQHSSLGGVWTNTGKVPYMSLQVIPGHYRFPDYTVPASRSASDVQRYVEEYARDKHLKNIHRNTRISQIVDTGSTLTVMFNGLPPQTFDYVILTGLTTHKYIPPMYAHLPNTIHSSELSATAIDTIRRHKLKCIVVGGSKSAVDAVYNLGIDRATWVARKFYTYGRFNERTGVNISRVFACVPSIRDRAEFGNCLLGELKIRDSDAPNYGTGNLLTENEYKVLRHATTIKGKVVRVTNGKMYIRTDRGMQVETYDKLILCTGYRQTNHDVKHKLYHGTHPRVLDLERAEGNVLTTFGTINSHIVANACVQYLNDEESMAFPTYYRQWVDDRYYSLLLYQLQYLCMPRYRLCPYNQYPRYLAWRLTIVLLVVGGIVYLRRKKTK